MDKKTAVIYLVAILFFTIVSLAAIWFDPFQDSTVHGQISGTVKISNVTIPLGDIIKLARGDYTRQIGDQSSIDLSSLRDIDLGNIQIDVSIQGDGKNIDKMLRGILFAGSSNYFYVNGYRIPSLDNSVLSLAVETMQLLILVILYFLIALLVLIVSLKIIKKAVKWKI